MTEQSREKGLPQISQLHPSMYAGVDPIRDSPNQLVNYATLAELKMGPEELIFKFAHADEEDVTKGECFAKVFLSPAHAKRFLASLSRTIETYENIFGRIEENAEARVTESGKMLISNIAEVMKNDNANTGETNHS